MIEELIEYYTDLLIIQYNGKPKARATIRACVSEVLANGILFDIRDGYNVETAVGVQLDIIGKYVGVNRFFTVSELDGFYRMTDYTEVDPDESPGGFTDYENFDENQFNGTLNYNSLVTVENKLNDEDFRTIIKLKIIQNNSDHSHKSIDDSMWEYFGSDVIPDSLGGMEMSYFLTENITPVIQAALIKGILPRPMGVGLTLINNVTGPFFGMPDYGAIQDSIYSPFATGFSNYDDYDTKIGETLTYNQITVV